MTDTQNIAQAPQVNQAPQANLAQPESFVSDQPEAFASDQTNPQAPAYPKFLQVELIPKQSTLAEIEEVWKATGRSFDVKSTGAFFFSRASNFSNDKGNIQIESDGRVYFYNQADFYRVKVTPIY